jgi:hypothetical protein
MSLRLDSHPLQTLRRRQSARAGYDLPPAPIDAHDDRSAQPFSLHGRSEFLDGVLIEFVKPIPNDDVCNADFHRPFSD